MQVSKSLTLLGKFTKGSHGKTANLWIRVVEKLNYVWHHVFYHLDKFHWKKIKSRGGTDCRYLNYLHCSEISLRAVTAQWHTHELVSLSKSTMHGTTLSISLTSSAGKKQSRDEPDCADD